MSNDKNLLEGGMKMAMYSQDMRELASALNMMEQLSASKKSSSYNRERLMNTLISRKFINAIIAPKTTNEVEKRQVGDLVVAVYNCATRPFIIHMIAKQLEEMPYMFAGRDVAVFFVSLVNLGMSEMNVRAQDLGNRRDHRDISDDEYESIMRKFERYQEDLETILSAARKIIRSDARVLSRHSGVPKKLCQSGLYTVPTPSLLNTYKIGYYLDLLLNNIYGFVDMTGGLVDFRTEVNWTRYFEKIFSTARLPDVASLIMLESPDRITKYKNQPAAVRDCWDSLTTWALKTLNNQSSDIRDHMIELLLKRINNRLEKWKFNTRIDLRKIDNVRFGDLFDTISKYKSKFDELAEKAAVLSNAKKDSSII